VLALVAVHARRRSIRDSAVAAESAMKYFVLGAIASAAALRHLAAYGITGTLQLDELAARVGATRDQRPALLALAFIVVGIAFKFGAVPFHMWCARRLPRRADASDVVHRLRAEARVVRARVARARGWAGPLHDGGWRDMLIVPVRAVAGIGNLVAIAQTNIKRMLAYSTISHVGSSSWAFIAGNEQGSRPRCFYTFAYVLMAAAAFGMVILLSRRGFEAERLEDFKGLKRAQPVVRARDV
jgi:NADH-quinone oxidoreductase subunit N